MDTKRVFSLVMAAVALALCVVALAAAFAFLAPGDDDVGGVARYSAAFGGTVGFAARAFLLHRRSGTRLGMLWALAQGGSMALLLFGTVVVATAVSPMVRDNSTLGGDAWMGIMAAGVVIGLTSTLLWERDARRRRIAASFLLASGFIVGGLAGLRGGGPWTPIGAISLAVGFVALVAALVQGFAELRQEIAETAA